MPLQLAQLVVVLCEGYVLLGIVFATLFLPRAVVRMDGRLAESSTLVRLLILPGVAALWPLFARRWMTGCPVPIERNPHRERAGDR